MAYYSGHHRPSSTCKSAKSREVLLNPLILTFFSSDTEVGKELLGRNRKMVGNNREKSEQKKGRLLNLYAESENKTKDIPTPGEMAVHHHHHHHPH